MVQSILVTGGAGTLGRALAPLLLREGYRVRLLDIVPPEAAPGAEALQGDIRLVDDVRRAIAAMDALVHTAAWHGIHLRDHPAEDFWELNVEGTRNVYEAAAQAGVSRAVFSSTMGVYGDSRRPSPGGPAVRVHEDLPLLPADIYGLSKLLGEEIAAYHERAHQIRGVALRFGMFVPVPFVHYGIRLLYGGVDERDVARAVVAALRRLERGEGAFAVYNVESALPFNDDDGRELRRSPMSAVARHWPHAPVLLGRFGTAPWNDPVQPGAGLLPIHEVFEVDKARRELGWQPRYNFDQFLEGLRRGTSTAEELVPPQGST